MSIYKLTLEFDSQHAEIIQKVLSVDKDEIKNVEKQLQYENNHFIVNLKCSNARGLRTCTKHLFDQLSLVLETIEFSQQFD